MRVKKGKKKSRNIAPSKRGNESVHSMKKVYDGKKANKKKDRRRQNRNEEDKEAKKESKKESGEGIENGNEKIASEFPAEPVRDPLEEEACNTVQKMMMGKNIEEHLTENVGKEEYYGNIEYKLTLFER